MTKFPTIVWKMHEPVTCTLLLTEPIPVIEFYEIHVCRKILTKLGTKHPWLKGIQVCSNEGPRPLRRGDNYEKVKIHFNEILKSSSPEPLGQFQPILAQSILG